MDDLPEDQPSDMKGIENIDDSDSFLKISKSEYEDIKDRVTAIETRISREFTKLQSTLNNESMDSVDMLETEHLNGPEKVLDKYERALEETEMINASPSTELLANRLSRGLKIRRSAENKVFRSPSARKIGNIRRRSQDNVRLSRNNSWHMGSTPKTGSVATVTATNLDSYFNSPNDVSATARAPTQPSFYPNTKISNKRGQPKAIAVGICQTYPSPIAIPLDDKTNKCPMIKVQAEMEPSQPSLNKKSVDLQLQNEKWVCADIFFDDSMSQGSFSSPMTGSSSSTSRRKRGRDKKFTDSENENTPRASNDVPTANSMKTPMLPPRLTSVKKASVAGSVPNSPYSAYGTKSHLTPIMQDYHQHGGRASIARLRSQNAGMVMAKAKLFDELGTDLRSNGTAKTVTNQRRDVVGHSQFMAQPINANTPPKSDQKIEYGTRRVTPRKTSGSNRNSPIGIQRRQQLRHLNYTPLKKSPLAVTTTMLSISDNNRSYTEDGLIQGDTTPHIKRILAPKTPRCIVRTPQNKRKAASPLRATTPYKYRHSPRLQALK